MEESIASLYLCRHVSHRLVTIKPARLEIIWNGELGHDDRNESYANWVLDMGAHAVIPAEAGAYVIRVAP